MNYLYLYLYDSKNDFESVCRFLINRVTGAIWKIVKKFGRIDVYEYCCMNRNLWLFDF